MQLRRFDRLKKSAHPTFQILCGCRFLKGTIRRAERACQFKREYLSPNDACLRFWERQLHSSVDRACLGDSRNAPFAQQGVSEGTHLLTGRSFIDSVKLRINAMPTRLRTKRGREANIKCRAGCDTVETLGHVLQRCHRTHFVRTKRHDNIVAYLSKQLLAKGW
ncbi:unnamed protein product [Ixodes hexagonus]